MRTRRAPRPGAGAFDVSRRRRRRRCGLALIALAVTTAGCGSALRASERSDVIHRILTSTVQLRSEREGGGHRAASGVVVATDPTSGRAWIVTVRHFLSPSRPQQISIRLPDQRRTVPAVVHAVSGEEFDLDLAIIEVEDPGVVPVVLKETASLGDEILIVAFPWGQRVTVVRGIVSQIAVADGASLVSGPARMVDAPVSHGSSGGGVFDARTGELVGIVAAYRTAKIAIPEMKGSVLEIPVPGETTIVPTSAILHFLLDFGLGRRLTN